MSIALFGAGVDARALNQDKEQSKLIDTVYSYFGVTRKSDFNGCSACQMADYSLSKLYPLPDKGGKTRTIAIGDVWTQLSLGPLHKLCMKILASLPGDFTFKQDEAVTQMCRTKCPKYSLDLKSATDRFPI